jgi:hemerythrin
MNAAPSSHGIESTGIIDAEHQVQIGLVRALCDAIRLGADAEQRRQILEQLIEYSAVHFMSEQLLMRLCSYPEYDDHVLDHDHMTEALQTVAAKEVAGEGDLALNEAEDMLGFLSRHIATRDLRFTEYYLDWSRRAAVPGTKAPELNP